MARRSGLGEVVDAETLGTVASVNFDFNLERLSADADGSALHVEGYAPGSACCKHYTFEPTTLKLQEGTAADEGIDGSFGECRVSPDGRWCVRLRSFGGPALKIIDRLRMEPLVQVLLPNLPPEDRTGNWNAQGTWLGDRFYLYVSRPDDPGLLWAVSPGTQSLGAGTPVAPFNEDPSCGGLPTSKNLVAGGSHRFLYESFGNRNKSSRGCAGIPGGAWILDPASGRLALRSVTP